MAKRTFSGEVVSHKMDKTVVVRVKCSRVHALYGKRVVQTKKYMAHDEHNGYTMGDQVVIRESRPISKTKKWEVMGLCTKNNVESKVVPEHVGEKI